MIMVKAIKMFRKSQLEKQKEYVRNEESGTMQVKDALQDVLREIAIMKALNHISMIRLHEVIDDVHTDKLLLGIASLR